MVQSPANHRCCDEISRERDRPPYGVLIDPVLFGSMKYWMVSSAHLAYDDDGKNVHEKVFFEKLKMRERCSA